MAPLKSLLPLSLLLLILTLGACSVLGGLFASDPEQVEAVETATMATVEELMGLQAELEAARDAGTLTEAHAAAINAKLFALQESLLALAESAKEPDGDIGWTELLLGMVGVYVSRGLDSKGLVTFARRLLQGFAAKKEAQKGQAS